MNRNRKKHTPKISTFNANLPVRQGSGDSDNRSEQVEAVKEFSATSTVANPYQSLPATGLSRVITKRLPEDMAGIVQYYNHIDAIQATSFVEKCRILAHASSLFRDPDTRDGFKKQEGNWQDFLAKIGMSHSQVNRFVSFWNTFGPKILEKTIEQEFSATKLAELLSWPEDPRPALLEGKTYPTKNGEKGVYEMTREELREVKRMLLERREGRVIENTRTPNRNIRITFNDDDALLYQSLLEKAREEAVSEDEIIRRALDFYIKNSH
ncbi:hypothetical protein ABXV15_14235 [Exiguobacterium profundum]|uniref:hypothetical protein n=1 Tax=Exiguobacterium profundum TaxID=307643 RepID=UPI00339702B7